jgi:hypothetical protein
VVNDLAKQYIQQDKPVLFLEHDVDDNTDIRQPLWWRARGQGGVAGTPMTMVDSGFQWTSGQVDFKKKFSSMVDAALKRPAGADLTALFQRQDRSFTVYVDVTNRLDKPLGYDDYATLDVVLFEDSKVIHLDRFVRAQLRQTIDDDIAPGATAHFELELEVDAKIRANFDKSHVLVILDHRPATNGPHDLVQSVLAEEGVPTATPEPSPTPTMTEEPTATDAPTVTPFPTVTPTRDPNAGSRLYLPSLMQP